MKIIIATGGSGGHLFPALKVAQEFQRGGHEIKFLGSFSRAQEQMEKSGFAFEDLGAKGFVPFLRKGSISSIFAMFRAIGKGMGAIKKFKADVVIGFGGYGAFPAVFSAFILRCPRLIHEQNVIPGKANALLAKITNKIAISFEKSRKYFHPKRTVLTGCPCHAPHNGVVLDDIYSEFGLTKGIKTLLVLGGSQGSQRINETFIDSANLLRETLKFQVIHICGKNDFQKLYDRYNHLGIPFALFEFLDRMEKAYKIADLVISRAGAVTVCEIASFQLPAILIPYPHAGGHQVENANVLCETRFSMMIREEDLSASKLSESIMRVFENLTDSSEKLSGIYDFCLPDASQRVAKETLQLIQ